MSRSEAMLEALAKLSMDLASTTDLDSRIGTILESLSRHLGYDHAMLLVPADDKGHVVMLACHGYDGGVGAMVPIGQGVIGVCAERRRAMRINNVAREISMVQAFQEAPGPWHIPFPGLADVSSQIAVPAVAEDKLVAVLYAEDTRPGRFMADDAHALQVVANMLAAAIRDGADEADPAAPVESPGPNVGRLLRVRFYESDGSVFFDDEYVIKSLPGRILYRLLKARKETGRQEFTNKELRLDDTLPLPPVRDNLDTRLILLRRRLAERFAFVRLESVGRGRFCLRIERPFELIEAKASYP
jgi:adenylate cyclase